MENPDINYIGIEKYSSVLIRAIERCEEIEVPNLRFIRMEAEYSVMFSKKVKWIEFT